MGVTRQAQSKFEKFVEGVTMLAKYQPAAEVDVVSGHILVGSAEDPHISEGARKYLKSLGFFEDATNKMFAFPVNE
jgi:hypothetical protein